MGLLKIIQIPCHHVLANQNALKFKKGAPLKQFLKYKFGDRYHKKTIFLFVFSTYLPVFLLKFRLGELVGCIIKSHIQRVPTWHTFDGPRYPKKKKHLKKCDGDIIITFFQVSLVLGVARSVKSMPSGYSLDTELKQKYVKWVLVGCGI